MNSSATEEFETHRAALAGIAYRMLGSYSDAEDIVQDAWLRWRDIDHGTVDDSRRYLARVVSNLCLDRLKAARKLVSALPDGHPFKGNPNLGDHHDSDAGFYDLLLHSQDRAFDVPQLLETMARSGWELSGFTMPALYDLARITDVPEHLDPLARMAVAEKLRGTIKTHVGYAVPSGEGRAPANGRNRALIPHLKGVDARTLAQAVAQGSEPKLSFAGVDTRLRLPKQAAPLIAAIDGRRSLTDIAATTRTDPIGMGATWARIEAELTGWGLMVYSGILR